MCIVGTSTPHPVTNGNRVLFPGNRAALPYLTLCYNYVCIHAAQMSVTNAQVYYKMGVNYVAYLLKATNCD